jgi:hypothetical protein
MKLCALDFPHFQSQNCRGPPSKGCKSMWNNFRPKWWFH